MTKVSEGFEFARRQLEYYYQPEICPELSGRFQTTEDTLYFCWQILGSIPWVLFKLVEDTVAVVGALLLLVYVAAANIAHQLVWLWNEIPLLCEDYGRFKRVIKGIEEGFCAPK